MRISDWSSDVCSSDLRSPERSGRSAKVPTGLTPPPVFSGRGLCRFFRDGRAADVGQHVVFMPLAYAGASSHVVSRWRVSVHALRAIVSTRFPARVLTHLTSAGSHGPSGPCPGPP